MGLRERAWGAARTAGTALSKAVQGIGLPAITTPLVDRKAQEIISSEDALFGSIMGAAGRPRDRFSSYPGNDLTPAIIQQVQRSADLGIMRRWCELNAQIVKRDSRMKTVLRQRRVAVTGSRFITRPNGTSDEALALGAFVEEALDGLTGWKRALRQLLAATYDGYGVVEVIWRYRTVRFPYKGSVQTFSACVPDELRWAHGKHFRFDNDEVDNPPLETGQPMLQVEGQLPQLDTGTGSPVFLPRNKFILHPAADEGRINERGIMRQGQWLSLMGQRASASWGHWVDMFGLPVPRGSVPFTVWQDQKRSARYLRLLEFIGEGVPILFPNDLKIDIDGQVAGGRSTDAFGSIIGWIDTQKTILALGEHLTIEIGNAGSYGQSAQHRDEKRDVVQDDADALCDTLREQLFRAILRKNAARLQATLSVDPEALAALNPVPMFVVDRTTTRLERLRELAVYRNELGGKVTERQAQDEGGIFPPAPGEAVIPGGPQQMYPGSKMVSTDAAVKGVLNPPMDPPGGQPADDDEEDDDE